MATQTLDQVITKLTNQRNALRRQYAELYVKAQYATHHLKPTGRNQYLSYIGGLEAQLGAVQAEVVAAKRLCAEFQQQTHGKSAVLRQLEQVIAADMKPWRTANAELAIRAAKANRKPLIAELQQTFGPTNALYAELAELLHPLLTAHDALAAEYWPQIQAAYRQGDRLALKLIQQKTVAAMERNHDCYITLKNDLRRIHQGLEGLEDQAQQLRNDVELKVSLRMHDELWVHRRRQQLQNAIRKQKQQLAASHQQMALALQAPLAG